MGLINIIPYILSVLTMLIISISLFAHRINYGLDLNDWTIIPSISVGINKEKEYYISFEFLCLYFVIVLK